MRSSNDNTFCTDNFILASLLLSESCHLLSVDRTNPRRVAFIFENTDKRQSLTDKFLAHEALVEVHRYNGAQRDLKQLIYEKDTSYT